MQKRLFCLSNLIALLLVSFTLARSPNQGVYYQVFVRSFQDTTGDGIGDFGGVTERLDYLSELGVSGLWLMPIHPSPSYHGYDVTDYYAVNPDYGTMADFERLLSEAHARGIRVVIDHVLNHSSAEHPWFRAARAGDPRYRDWYIWSDEDLGWRSASGSAAWIPLSGDYYYAYFWGGMPDLNFKNPEVNREMEEVTRFWLEMGVDGFRVDALQHIVEGEDGRTANAPENFAWVRDFQAFVRSVDPDAFVVGETWTDTQTIVRYHEQADLDMSFNFPRARTMIETVNRRNPFNLQFLVEQDMRLYPDGAWVGTFLANHDQPRLATTLRGDVSRLKLAAGMLLTLPGTPFLYYGEEIGMPSGPGDRDEEKRTPMRWEAGPQAGFTTGRPWYAFSSEDEAVTVAAQLGDPDSLLNWYKTLIALRNSSPALAHGLYETAPLDVPNVYAFIRSSAAERMLVVANFSAQEREADLTDLLGADAARDLISGETLEAVLTLGPVSMIIVALGD
jgi:glycosidase